MRRPLFDPTAGVRAQEVRVNPGVPQPIPDPTDPRCGEIWSTARDEHSDPQRIVDPTNPDCGGLAV